MSVEEGGEEQGEGTLSKWLTSRLITWGNKSMEGIYFIFLGMKVRGTFNEEGKNNKEEKVEDG